MHIPDTAISPATSAVAMVAMLPIWAAAGRHLRRELDSRQVPLLAVGSAFCFTIMMFNIPVPGGTTVHPVGGALLGALLGPWAAVIGVTTALVIQCLFFGDGGILALGANCFTMAFAMPFVGYVVYRGLCGKSPTPSRSALAAGFGAYVGLNAAALLTAIILGIQPSIAHEPGGRALYFPFGLHVSLPAIMSAHLLVAGVMEAIVTALIVKYVATAGLLNNRIEVNPVRKVNMLWAGLAAMVALTPLGLLAKGDAWGEWGVEEISKRAGFVPRQLAAVEKSAWKGFNFLPDYGSERGATFYILAAVLGILLIVSTTYLLWRVIKKREVPPAIKPSNGGGSTLKPGEAPEWMLINDNLSDTPSGDARSTRIKLDFSHKTLEELSATAHQTLASEPIALSKGLLQSVDSRFKLASALAIVIALSLTHKPYAALFALFAAWIIGIASAIPPGLLLKRTAPFAVLFGGVVGLPAMLNVVTPGTHFASIPGTSLYITSSGIFAGITIFLRLAAVITVMQIFTLTTPRLQLLRSLRSFGAPQIFVMTLEMTHRYLTVLTRAAADGFVARKSRLTGAESGNQSRHFLGQLGGALFGKTLSLADEVHSAMVSRGWDGSAVASSAPQFSFREHLLTVATFGCLMVILVLDRIVL